VSWHYAFSGFAKRLTFGRDLRSVIRRGLTLAYKCKTLLMTMLLWAVYGVSGLIPRDHNLWVFGAARDAFVDNTKYLFIHVSRTRPNLRAIWISGSAETVQLIRELGFEAHVRHSIKGWWYCFRAQYYFTMMYITDINHFASRRAVFVNLWHGTPLKKIEHDIQFGPMAPLYNSPSWRTRFIWAPGPHKIPNFVLSASEFVSRYALTSAFKVPLERCLAFGYPRNDILFSDRDAVLSWLSNLRQESLARELRNLIETFRVVLFLPTWRESGDNAESKRTIPWAKLNEVMRENNCVLLAKPHPAVAARRSGLPRTDEYSNIRIWSPNVDIYPIMAVAEVLITDYSSVIFDFCLTRRPIIVAAFEDDRYSETERELYMPVEDIMIGEVVKSPEQLIACLTDILANRESSNYDEKSVKRFNDFLAAGATMRVAEFFEQHA
jgi:CDP-glycerol glycerophosphotransferase (TagB/SpsB family)